MLEKRLKSTFSELLATQTVIGNNLYPQEPKLLGEFQTFSKLFREIRGAKFELISLLYQPHSDLVNRIINKPLW